MLADWAKLTDTVILDVPCEDNNIRCPEWSRRGECEKNPGYMLVDCRKSCKVCKGNKIQQAGAELCQARSLER